MSTQTQPETVAFEPWWVSSLSCQLEDILDDRNLTAPQLSQLTGIPLSELEAFLKEQIPDLTSAQYLQIETALRLPENYFVRMKAEYRRREEREQPFQ